MNAETIQFAVLGTPTPKGSKTRMPNGAMLDGRSANARNAHAAWADSVAAAAATHAERYGQQDGPLHLAVEFRFPMPASARKAARDAGWCWKTSAPDLDKLVRTVGDALKVGGLITDDARIVSTFATKVQRTEWTGAVITLCAP